MEWEKETAADIVMGTAAKVAEDMVNGTAAAVQDISRYSSMYKSMAGALRTASDNLQKHALRKKWLSSNDKKAMRLKISQIKAVAKVCDKLQLWCAGFASGAITELQKMEMNKKLSKIVSRIEIDKEE